MKHKKSIGIVFILGLITSGYGAFADSATVPIDELVLIEENIPKEITECKKGASKEDCPLCQGDSEDGEVAGRASHHHHYDPHHHDYHHYDPHHYHHDPHHHDYHHYDPHHHHNQQQVGENSGATLPEPKVELRDNK